jgi:hypothetical protein
MGDPDPENLSGLWHGQYNYPTAKEPVAFIANLIDGGGTLGGSITEKSTLPPRVGQALFATIRGIRDGAAVSFAKTYQSDDPRYTVVRYEGQVSADATEIEGTWRTGGWTGKFLMIRGRAGAAATSRGVLEPVSFPP